MFGPLLETYQVPTSKLQSVSCGIMDVLGAGNESVIDDLRADPLVPMCSDRQQLQPVFESYFQMAEPPGGDWTADLIGRVGTVVGISFYLASNPYSGCNNVWSWVNHSTVPLPPAVVWWGVCGAGGV